VSKIKDEIMLARLARDAPYDIVRLKACERLDDPELWAQLARSSANANIRSEAYERLDDQGLWVQAATNDAASWVRLKALDRVKDQIMLARLARDAPYDEVRLKACERLDDPELWAQLARDAPYDDVRLKACERLEDPGLWARWARETTDAEVRLRAFSEAFDQLIDDYELCRKVVNDSLTQIKKINSLEIDVHLYGVKILHLLERIARHDPGLVRQFWPQIALNCHEDNPSSSHWDVPDGSNDCSHGDDYSSKTPHHRDRSNSDLLKHFPAAARS
jgi:hypothetical protein